MTGERVYFPGGPILQHVLGSTYQRVTLDGKPLGYVTALAIVYKPTIEEQLRSRNP